MDEVYLANLINELSQKGINFAPGLTDEEIAQVETTYNFRFPPDLKAFLQHTLPISKGFPNWREDSEQELRGRLDWPLDGILFDIEHNSFWMEDWGEKPSKLKDAFEIARKEVAKVPRLIPIFVHRFLPTEPFLAGNPVFSVYQTDIIYYGNDLASYFAAEFSVSCPTWAATEPRQIRFWSDFV
jgi:hypothetical protein